MVAGRGDRSNGVPAWCRACPFPPTEIDGPAGIAGLSRESLGQGPRSDRPTYRVGEAARQPP
jgi:hypothetical protein